MTDETLKSRQISCFNTDTICLKGKAHHTDYPKLAAIEYEIIQYGEWFFPLASGFQGRRESEIEEGEADVFPSYKI